MQGKTYFFNGSQYSRYDVRGDRVDPGCPRRIRDHWPGLFTNNIAAAVNWGNGKVYFFSGDQYCRYDVTADQVDPGYPRRIRDHWPGLFTANITAAVNWGDGKVYFFSGDRYCRYDIQTDQVDRGYPLRIRDHWPGLFVSGIDAAVDWRLGFVTRAQWGAAAPRRSAPVPIGNRTEYVVHYSTGQELGRQDTPDWVLNIQNYHMNLRSRRNQQNFDDIGYNFLVDIYGNVFEGRGRDVAGAHCPGHNTSGIGVCFLGNDDPGVEDVTPQAKWSIRQLWVRFSDDAGRRLAVHGHRDFRATGCPGDELHAWIGAGMPVN